MIRIGAMLAGLLGLFIVSESCRAAPPTSTHELDRDDVESWLDGLLPAALSSGDIAGAVVTVVQDGHALLEKGYGYAEVASRKPMDPANTLIRPGSISKLFTWTAVMQLVERGQLDLDADVNRYLDFKIPAQNGKPITIRNLLTHTTSFEETYKGLLGREPGLALGAYLKDWIPERMFAAGTVPAYSNYAAGLAGYIIERVSGSTFETYVEQNILAPLGMTLSTFAQPVPAPWRSRLSSGYERASGPAKYFEVIGAPPAGSLTSTAHDMSQFMIAHLQNGSFGAARILGTDTAIRMHAARPRFYPALNGMALGFYETSRNGHRVIAHNGGTQFFHSDLHLFIDDGVGLFISLNSAGRDAAASEIHHAFFAGFADRYFPASTPATTTQMDAETAAEHARLMAGPWESSRRSDSSFMSLLNLLSTVTITDNGDGTLSLPLPGHGLMRWHEIAPFVWSEVDGPEKMQAILIDGRPAMLGFGMAPPAAFLPVPGSRSPTWLMPALMLALTALLLKGLALPVGAISRKIYGLGAPDTGRAAGSRRAMRIASLCVVAVFIAFVLLIVYMTAEVPRLSDATDPYLVSMQLAALIAFPVATVVSIYDAFIAWSSGGARPAGLWLNRLRALLVVASCVTLLWTAFAFHLMKIGTSY